MIKYLFPYHLIEHNSKIVLYAAGNVGKDYYYQLTESGYCKIVAWLDKNYDRYIAEKMPVDDPRILSELKYDYIVVAVNNEKRYQSIHDELTSQGIESKDILWDKPTTLWADSSFYIDRDQEIAKCKEKELEEIPAKDIVSSERMDIIIRYLFARDILAGINTDEHKNLYSRFILTVNGAEEPVGLGTFHDQFTDYNEKRGIASFTSDFEQLVDTINMEGFFREKYIPLNREGGLLNGSHRLATALALEEKIWINYFDTSETQDYWTIERLEKTGFSVKDRLDVLRGFSDLYENCGILIMYSEIENIWEYVRNHVLKGYSIVGYVAIDLEKDFIAWDNLQRDIFGDVSDKKSLLAHRMQIVLYSDENNKGQDLFESPLRRWNELRTVMNLPDDAAYIASDREDYRKLRLKVLSSNNIEKAGMRLRNLRNSILRSRLDDLRRCLNDQGVDWEDICLTDEAIMEVFGLRQAEIIKVLVSKENKKKLILPDGFEIENRYNEAFCRFDRHFFVWNDTKILNPEIVMDAIIERIDSYSSKIEGLEDTSEYIRDCKDHRYLQLLFDYYRCFEHNKDLSKNMDFAIHRQYLKDLWFRTGMD